jgi:hypothetical protein
MSQPYHLVCSSCALASKIGSKSFLQHVEKELHMHHDFGDELFEGGDRV